MNKPSPYSIKASPAYISAIDGIRAVSILLVLFSHAGLQDVIPGNLGVLIFFVISGFLITRLMIVEVEAHGTLSLKAFYLRRIFRLMPAMLVYLVIFGTACVYLFGAEITTMHILSGVFYFANYYQVYIGYPDYSPVPILWSLSVEEHYYIVFPFIMLLFRKNPQRMIKWLLAAVVVVLVWRFYVYAKCENAPDWPYCGLPTDMRFHTTTTIVDCIFYGSLLALVLHYAKDGALKWLLGPAALFAAGFGLLLTLVIRDPQFRETIRFTLQSLCVAVLIMNVLYSSFSLPRTILCNPVLIYIGKLSYSLYLFHFGVLNVLHGFEQQGLLPQHSLLTTVLYLVASLGCAALSYHYIEQPMLALRKRLGSTAK